MRDEERLFRVGRTWHTWFYLGDRRVKRSTGKRSKSAARIVARQYEEAAADPARATQAAYTIEDALWDVTQKKREDAKAKKKSDATVEFYEKKSKVIVAILGNDFPLTQLRDTSAALDHYVSQRRRGGATDHTIYKEMVVVRAALKWARKQGKWRGDLTAVMPELSPGYKPRKGWATPEQLDKLLGDLEPDDAARAAFIVATSAELGATERAQRKDVGDDLVHLRGTKRETRLRDVPVVTTWQRSLIDYADDHAKGPKEGVLFKKTADEFRWAVRYACRRQGLPHLTPNDLRRTFATWLRASGAHLENIAPAMGHADTRMLERVYDGTTPAQLGALLSADLGLDTVWTEQSKPAGNGETRETAGPRNPEEKVPRGGIEPPTRGFSIPCSTD